jgi:hypothetical protein
MDINALVTVLTAELVKQITPAVVEAVKAEINIHATAQAMLDPGAIVDIVNNCIATSDTTRDALRDMVGDAIDNSDFSTSVKDLESKMEDMESTVYDLKEAADSLGRIDADDEDFADAVREVIRNCL